MGTGEEGEGEEGRRSHWWRFRLGNSTEALEEEEDERWNPSTVAAAVAPLPLRGGGGGGRAHLRLIGCLGIRDCSDSAASALRVEGWPVVSWRQQVGE